MILKNYISFTYIGKRKTIFFKNKTNKKEKENRTRRLFLIACKTLQLKTRNRL